MSVRSRRSVSAAPRWTSRPASSVCRQAGIHRILRLSPGCHQQRHAGSPREEGRPVLGGSVPSHRPQRYRQGVRANRAYQQPVRQGRRGLCHGHLLRLQAAQGDAQGICRCHPEDFRAAGRGCSGADHGRIHARATWSKQGADPFPQVPASPIPSLQTASLQPLPRLPIPITAWRKPSRASATARSMRYSAAWKKHSASRSRFWTTTSTL